MENKEILIDSVDVSGCKTFYINASHPERQECINPYCKGLCKDNPNCYYKQLKRKEQECEKLNIYIESNKEQVKYVEKLVMDNDRLINELDQLKAENEKLDHELYMTVEEGRAWYDLMERYEQALTEIREITEKGHKEKGNLMRTWWFKDILQKCEILDET